MIKTKSFLFLFLTFSFIIFSANKCKKEDYSSVTDNSSTANNSEISKLINDYRESKKLTPLKYDSYLEKIALTHSQKMASGKVEFGHDGFDDRFNQMVSHFGNGAAAENVAYGYTSSQSVVEGWIKSTGHRHNIEGDYTLTGIGIAFSSDKTPYYTQVFYKPNSVKSK